MSPSCHDSAQGNTPTLAGKSAPRIILVGAPNCGKTTLFNALTGAHYRTVNYPGSTVEYAMGSLSSHGLPHQVVDTPGMHSLHPDSLDQQVAVDQLFSGGQPIAALVAVIDATQFTRHYPLVLELKHAGFPLILALTMSDILAASGKKLDLDLLRQQVEVPVVLLDTPRKKGFGELLDILREVSRRTSENISATLPPPPNSAEIRERIRQGDALAQRIFSSTSAVVREPWDWDRIFLHPFAGLLVFLSIMTLIFSAIFWWATPAMDLVDEGFGWAIDYGKATLPESWWADMLTDGLLAGVGSVAIFVPQIVVLFLCMGILEDSGYLARGAVLIDRPLRAIGLTGRSFVPIMSGFACAIPAMMAARTIRNRRERLLTLLILPLMTCSARLPVYALLISFMTPRDQPWIGGLMLTGLYVAGLLSGAVVASLASRLLPSGGERSRFMLELPAYRRPLLKIMLVHTFHRALNYVRKAGLTIVVISLLLWVATHIPGPGSSAPSGLEDPDGEYTQISGSVAAWIGKGIEPLTEPMGIDWRGGVAMICGFAAREVFVSSMALMYRIEEDDEDALRSKLLQSMREETFEGRDQKIFTLSTCLGLLFFFVFALQCFPTTVVCAGESNSRKFALLQLLIFTAVAYAGAVAIVQVTRYIGFA